ncbi:plasmid mobilization relaxosome protein MobC [Rathayibacter caricis]|uniref:plasmid mobilization protein n=1 Tax=Rathayibacter caricis TaxID=110936 RepID=UPI001FB3EC02|nr:plasmid mobilization relaxosome protein MobC [Rathayibacter caricis]MCJ1698007.1 plasmid mobilization relaxosome protein MobC [Rathayibacter caricis]
MSDDRGRALFSRKRRANVEGDEKRDKPYRVYVTDEERVQLEARAVVQSVTVPRLLFESAMNAQVRTDTEWKQAVAELFSVNSRLENLTNNVNQLAKFANTEGRFPDEAAAIYREFQKLAPEIREAVRRVAGL